MDNWAPYHIHQKFSSSSSSFKAKCPFTEWICARIRWQAGNKCCPSYSSRWELQILKLHGGASKKQIKMMIERFNMFNSMSELSKRWISQKLLVWWIIEEGELLIRQKASQIELIYLTTFFSYTTSGEILKTSIKSPTLFRLNIRFQNKIAICANQLWI